ncbi:endonuclease [Streptomyces armeniacus]|uniref:Endonuclease n=1 Tax=Streptomyces armeniacus TaxID=83291 RepID=A0A345Y1V4_9ACTN|nr:endonuclease/exonuclease/phosphatase family protein [Streptomyces armeniacus]AXK37870.1 endonuclease [Streptomyces armeniacus]
MRVLTWNLWWRFGPWRERREAIRTVLREERPDVVGLQEVWADGTDNLAGLLADDLGMHWTWSPFDRPERWNARLGDPDTQDGTAHHTGTPAYGIGNAVLSRWPVLDRAVLRLPTTAGGQDDGRTALYALLDAPGGPLPFFTVHLNSPPHESAVRRQQVRAVAEFIAEHRDAPTAVRGAAVGEPFPPVLTGDFNAFPDSDEMRLLSGLRTAPAVPGQVLLDAWEYAGTGAPSATWDAANPYVAATHSPSVRIDYVLVGQAASDGRGAVRAVRRAGDAPVGGVWPSDHAAVVATLAADRDADCDADHDAGATTRATTRAAG